MTQLAKAELRQLDAEFDLEIEKDTWATVQFNPESLKVSFANQVATPSGSGDQNGSPSRLFVGAGTTKLAAQLWFDVSGEQAPGEAVDDVRKLTQKVAFFITPKKDQKDPKKFVPPAVRFLWGSFQFDGIMESLEESLEFFSSDGKPLRASVSFTLTQQKITKFVFRETAPPGTGGGDPAGTRPLTPAPAGSTVQGLAARQGNRDDWQGVATANDVENPRRLKPGQLLDMNKSRRPG
ncbi:CIS tube protein [Sorangium sp. So ce887]|uniref:CIS tube protein n=1 Tax=Sorangium sp. So ce887 TaxID=3133324 RepID=UPI003F5E8BEC